jgi:hypothetical protein
MLAANASNENPNLAALGFLNFVFHFVANFVSRLLS